MKKTLRILLCMVACCFLCACTQKVNTEKLAFYQSAKIEMPDTQERLLLQEIAAGEKTIAYCFANMTDAAEGSFYYDIYTMDMESSEMKKLEMEGSKYDTYYRSMTFDAEDTLYLFSTNEDKTVWQIKQVDMDGKTVKQIDVSEIFMEYFNRSELIEIKVDKNGIIYFFGTIYALVLDKDGNLLYTQENRNISYDNFVDAEHNVSLLSLSYRGEVTYFQYDAAKNQLTKTSRYAKLKLPEYREIIDGAEGYDFFYTKDIASEGKMGLYGVKGKEIYLLCHLDDTGLRGEYCYDLRVLSENRMVCNYGSDLADVDGAYFLERTDERKEDTRTQINMVGFNIDEGYRNAVSLFNRTSEDTYVNVIDYGDQYEDYNEAYRQLAVRVLGDTSTDLICLNYFPKGDFINQNLLVDLNTFWKADSEVPKDEILDCVLEACTGETGELYYFYPEFCLKTFMKQGEAEAFSFADLEEINQSLEAEQRLFYDTDKSTVLYKLVQYNPEQLIDYKNQKCTFDTAYFRSLLRLVKELKETKEEEISLPEAVRHNEVALFQEDIDSILYFMLFTQMCDKEVSFLGCPTEKGNRVVLDSWADAIGIVSTSKQQEAAWEFIQFMLQREQYSQLFGSINLPVRKDEMEETLEYMSATETYTKADGTLVKAVEGNYGVGLDDYTIERKPLSEQDIAQFEELCQNAVVCDGIKEAHMDIILEEADKYFKGQQDLDNTIKYIQSRVSTAVSE